MYSRHVTEGVSFDQTTSGVDYLISNLGGRGGGGFAFLIAQIFSTPSVLQFIYV